MLLVSHRSSSTHQRQKTEESPARTSGGGAGRSPHLGQRIRVLREAQVPEMRQEDLAARLEVLSNNVSRYENGRVRPPKKIRMKLAAIFGVGEVFFVDEPLPEGFVVPRSKPEPHTAEHVVEYVKLPPNPDGRRELAARTFPIGEGHPTVSKQWIETGTGPMVARENTILHPAYRPRHLAARARFAREIIQDRSVTKLAERSGLSADTIRKIEDGEGATKVQLRKLWTGLQVAPEWLVESAGDWLASSIDAVPKSSRGKKAG
jgi:transcriptional regulator with XRE-family HTH domain